MSDIIELIVERLEDDATVGTSAANRIYPAGAEQGAARPYITFQLISGGTVNDMAPNASATFEARLQINCWADTYGAAVTLANAVRSSLNGWRNTALTPKVQSCLLDEAGEGDTFDGPFDGTDTRLYGRRMDFHLWYATS
jgi:hypothetical protein